MTAPKTPRRPKPGLSTQPNGRPADDPRHPFNSSHKFMEAIHLLRLLARGSTTEEMMEAMSISNRTLFRRISALRQEGIGVVTSREGGKTLHKLQNQTLATAILAD